MIFLGTYSYNIDDKNRLSLPSKIACKFDGIAIVSKGFEGCLELRTQKDFEKRSQQLLELSQNKKDSRILTRQFLANSNELEIDKANRILIPSNLKQLANLQKEVVVIGVGDKLEIWDKEIYQEFVEATNDTYEAVAERMDDYQNGK